MRDLALINFNVFRLPDVIWKRILEESENFSKKRLEVSDGLQSKVVEEIKTFKANKAQIFKKVC